MKITTRMCSVVFGLLLSVSRAEAAKTWVEVDSPHFTVISADSESTTRDIAWQFEQVRTVVQALWPWSRVATDKPVVIYVAPDEDTMKMLAPQYWESNGVRPASVFVYGLDRYYVALRGDARLDSRGDLNPYFTAYRAYISLILNTTLRAPLPLWYSTGIAAVFGNTYVRNNEVQLGLPFDSYIRELRSHERLHLNQLIAADTHSDWFTNPGRRYTFDAESWLLVHFLLFGNSDFANSEKLNQYVKDVLTGMVSTVAFERAFGSPGALENAFAEYMKRPILTFMRAKADLSVKRETLPVRRLSPGEAAAARASFHIAAQRTTEAQADLDEARRGESKAAAVKDAEGLLFEVQREYDQAQVAFSDAVAAGSSNYYSYFRLANLPIAASAGQPAARKEELLTRAIELNDAFFGSYAALVPVKVQLGKQEEALSLAERGAPLAPTTFAAETLLARALSASRQDQSAANHAKNALTVAESDQQKTAARNLLQQIASSAATRLAPLPPPIPAPPNAVRISGAIPTPRRLKNVPPIYPEFAKTALVQGVVILEVIVGADGRVLDAHALRPLPFLDRAAIDAAKQWEFAPTVVDGKAVPAIMTIPINFALDPSASAADSTAPPPAPAAKPNFSSAPSPNAEGVYRLGSGITAPRILHEQKPQYTREAMAAQIQGAVLLQAVVERDGTVDHIRVLRSLDSNYGLDKEAVIAASGWKFEPATLQGVPVPVEITIELTFTLKGK